MKRTISLIFTFLFILSGTLLPLFAQEITEEDVKRSKLEKEYAENQKAIAEAQKAELAAKFPAPDVDALKTTTTAEGNLIEARIQAYKAMNVITEQIAANAQTMGITQLYILRDDDYAKIVAYKKLIQRLDIINAEYDKCYPGRPALAPVLGMLAPTILKWASLLKTDVKIKGAEFDIEDEAVWASLGNNLSARGIGLSNPFVSSFSFVDVGGVATTRFFNKLSSAEDGLNGGPCSGAYAFKAAIDASFTALKKEIGLEKDPPTLEKSEKQTVEVTGPPKTVTETTTKTPASSSGQVAINFWDYIITEKVSDNMVINNIYWIKIKNSKAGGNMRIKSNPLIDLFRGGNSVAFSGGAIAYYYILDNAGRIKESGVLTSYVPYRKSSNVTKPLKK